MSSDDIVSVRLRYSDMDMFVERFSPNVTRGGIFLATRLPRSIGSVVRFEVTLLRGELALAGEGKVTWVREYDPAEPQKPHGMGVQFMRIDPETRPVLDRILKAKATAVRPGQSQPNAVPLRTSGTFPTLDQARRTTAPQPTLERAGRITAPVRVLEGATAPAVDGTAELPPELALDEQGYRRAMDRARALAAEAGELEELLNPEPPVEAVEPQQAVAELSRLLQRSGEAQRRRTGSHRIVEPPPSGNDGSGQT